MESTSILGAIASSQSRLGMSHSPHETLHISDNTKKCDEPNGEKGCTVPPS